MTSNEKPTGRIPDVVVGVDGSPASVRALSYAVAEAARLGADVHVVHAIQTYVSMAPMYPLPIEDLTSAGRTVLERTVDAVEVPTTVRLRSTLARNGAIPSLVDASQEAALIVLGADRRPAAVRLFTGNVATGVAASSRAAVVAVPETWQPGEEKGVVLVGVKSPEHCDELLGEGFAVARARGARLVVMHAWQLPGGYDDMIARHATEDWDSRARAELEKAVAPWRGTCPEVEVELRTLHDQPAHAIVEASTEADEVVLVRRARGVPAALHLGPTARAVLAHAHCPVRIVPPNRRPADPDVELEGEGALKR